MTPIWMANAHALIAALDAKGGRDFVMQKLNQEASK